MLTTTALASVVGVAGLAAGSLANRAIDRALEKADEALASAPSVTDGAPQDTAPRPSQVRTLTQKRHRRAVIVAGATAALFVVLTLALESADLLPALPAYLWFAAAGVALSVIDVECKRLPNFLVLPTYPAVFGLLAVGAAFSGDWSALLRATIGAIALFGFYLVLALIHPAGMGFGDVKLAGVVGAILAFHSYGTLLVGSLLAFVAAAIAGAALLVGRRGGLGATIPFGPYMIAAALTAIVAAQPLSRLLPGAGG